MVGIVKSNTYFSHKTGVNHPENERRLKRLYALLERNGENRGWEPITPQLASTHQLAWAHSAEYIRRIAATSGNPYNRLTMDTIACADSYRAARMACGGVFAAVDYVFKNGGQSAFALVRPPGHHAEVGRAMGFCLFNNAALGAHYARHQYHCKRILIVDWDVHHGNGTQHIFERDPDVLFFSIHQFPHFPGTGLFTEIGFGAGEGYTFNVPLPKGYGDYEYSALFDALLRPMALEYAPDLIIVSAGFDPHRADPLGGMHLTELGFAAMTRSLMTIAQTVCQGRLVFVLEGGYHLESLTDTFQAVLDELLNRQQTDVAALVSMADDRKMNYALLRSRHVHRHYWSFLRDG
jgi:acetoin utilization deacetylase AcuC-like enzyme